MEEPTILLVAILGVLAFLAYWITGGVLFAAVAILRLGRIRKVRFSCLFTLLCLFAGVGASYAGLRFAGTSIDECLGKAETKAEIITGIFGCGFAGLAGAFLIGAAAMVAGGFLIMAISKSKNRPWINFEQQEDAEPRSQETGFFPKRTPYKNPRS